MDLLKMYPTKNGDIPASYVSLPEGIIFLHFWKLVMCDSGPGPRWAEDFLSPSVGPSAGGD